VGKFRKLGRPADQRRALLRNLVTSLVLHERVTTTVTRAKEARVYAERMITLGKRGDLAARRRAAAYLLDEEALKKLFNTLGPRYADRPGGYTRIVRTEPRRGDAAPMAILELV
jgi:large subunit ribosomal protein L17